ncbi:MAG TPA: ATP-binding protein [Casimicrobiaceae bacterium]|nr:ATP-binding protein [Casimicrobiaceae bacterium]
MNWRVFRALSMPASSRQPHGTLRANALFWRRRYPWVILAYLVGYVALDWVSYIYPLSPAVGITPWNPPPGLSLVLLLRYGLANGPWLFVAAAAAELIVRGPQPPLLVFVAAALPALVYTGLAAALRGPLKFQADFVTLRDATVFVAAVGAAAGGVATGYVGFLYLAGLLPAELLARSAAAQFWIGDLIGIVVTTPLLTTIAIMAIQIGIITAMRVEGYRAGTAVELQFLLLAVAVTGIFLGMTVSERRAIARQLHDKQFELDRSLRLAGASEMASALAHELNQPLTAIGSYVRACQLMLGEPTNRSELLRQTMDRIVAEVTRAGNVVRHLREFFRTGSGQIAAIAVEPMLREAIDAAAQRSERHRIRWRLACPPALPRVLADRVQVQTVLHNLVSNAIDALKTMPADDRELTLSARLDGAHFVRISVADNGPGLSEEALAGLFKPFATTKPQGMGLGLAISRSIVEARGGRMWSEPARRGSVFSFTLPTTEDGP